MKHFKLFFILITALGLSSHLQAGQQGTPEPTLDEFPQHSTDAYLYHVTTKTEPTEQIATPDNQTPQIISDTIHEHYFNSGKTRTVVSKQIQGNQKIITTKTWTTKNPSYLTWKNKAYVATAAAIAIAAYFIMQYRQQQTSLESAQKNQKVAPENLETAIKIPQNIQDVRDELRHLEHEDNTPYALLFKESQDFPERYKQIITKIKEHSDHHAYIIKKYLYDPYYYLSEFDIAFHEAGHALMYALASEDYAAQYATIITDYDQGTSGCVMPTPTSKGLLHPIFAPSHEHQEKELKARMMISLSGGIANQILKNQRLSAQEFLDPKYTQSMGMGELAFNNDNGKSDLQSFKILAQHYYRVIHHLPANAPVPEQAVQQLAIEQYENAYDILDAHKDRLEPLAEKLYQEKELDIDQIHNTLDIEKPKTKLHEHLPQPIIDFGKRALSDVPQHIRLLDQGNVDAQNYALSGYANQDVAMIATHVPTVSFLSGPARLIHQSLAIFSYEYCIKAIAPLI